MLPSDDSTILVVDDDRAIRQTLADILETEGYSVVQAANGAEALIQIGESLPRLILLDMRMPVMDGWQFARALKRHGLRFPIIVITAAQNARQWAQEVEAQDFLAKPFELDDLVEKVQRLCAEPPLPTFR
jgi:CheY-like chemotaxis protein